MEPTSSSVCCMAKAMCSARWTSPPVADTTPTAIFPNARFDKRLVVYKESSCVTKGNWQREGHVLYSDRQGNEIRFCFDGTGIAVCGWWVKNGGKADVYVDGTSKRTIDCYYNYGNHEHKDAYIYHIFNLKPGEHEMRIVVKGEKKPESQGSMIGVSDAVVFRTVKK